MHYFFRPTTTLTGALVLSGQVGCALTPETASVDAQSVTPASGAALVTDPAGIYSDPASASAYPTNYVEVHEAETSVLGDGFVPGYSNTFVSETKDGYPAGLFVSADYYDWGGYPVYYPYPYTLVSRPYGYQWAGACGNWPRAYSSYAGYGRGVTAIDGSSHGGRGIVTSRGIDRAVGARSKSGAVKGTRDGSGAYRPTDNGRQDQSGEVFSSKGSGRAPSPYAAAQNRGSQSSGTSHSSGYTGNRSQSSGQGYRSRARQSGMSGSYRFAAGGRAHAGRASGASRFIPSEVLVGHREGIPVLDPAAVQAPFEPAHALLRRCRG